MIYAIASGAVLLLLCMATSSCHLEPGANVVTAFALVALGLLGTGLVVMGGVLIAALLLRRIRWLYWWSVLTIAAASAALPSAVLCISQNACDQSGFSLVVGTLAFAGLCGGAYLWGTRLCHEASQPKLTQRIAAQSPAVKGGLVFLAAYVALLVAVLVFVVSQGGGEVGMIFLYLSLPWPSVGFKLFGHLGTGYGALLGLALNGVVAFGIGYGIARIFRRA